MKNPRSFSTFLEGFNLGTALSLISLIDVLLKSSSILTYSYVISLIILNGIVIGVVNQYLQIQLTLTKNMGKSFEDSGNKIPKRLLELRDNKLHPTLTLLVGISTRLRLNLITLVSLLGLLVLMLLLPIIYSWKIGTNLIIFNIVWSFVFLCLCGKSAYVIFKNSQFLQRRIKFLLELHQFNAKELSHKKS